MDKAPVFFNPIVNKDEKLELFQSLIDAKGSFLVKPETGSNTTIYPNKFSGDRGLMCAMKNKEDLERLHNTTAVFLFGVNNNYYFFESRCLKALDQIGITFKSPIFILQKRANTRVNIPESFKVDLLITKHKTLIMEHHGRLEDISLGGSKITLIDFPENLVKDDTLEAKIILPSKKEIDIKAQIKNVKLVSFVEKTEVEKIQHKKHDVGIMLIHDQKSPKEFEDFYISLQHELFDLFKSQEDEA